MKKMVILTIVLLMILASLTVFAMRLNRRAPTFLSMVATCLQKPGINLPKVMFIPLAARWAARYGTAIIPALKAHNYRVFAPTLKDEHSSNLTGHIEQICTLITENDLKDVILVGHSYGGMVITGVAAKMPDRISRLVYVDAALPDPGQSLFDIIVSGGRDPMSFAGLEPAAPYVEKLQFDAQKIKPLPKTYILCTESEFAAVTHVAKQKIAAAGKEWTYIELPSAIVPIKGYPCRTILRNCC